VAFSAKTPLLFARNPLINRDILSELARFQITGDYGMRCGAILGVYMIEENFEHKLAVSHEKQNNRARWERPVLRRLAANEAQNGGAPCNDGAGGGCGPGGNHS